MRRLQSPFASMRSLLCLFALAAACLPSALAGQWRILPLDQSVMMGLSFSSAIEGIVAGGDNGAGATVARTQTGGEKWEFVPLAPVSILMSAASSKQGSIVTGLGVLSGGTLYYDADKAMFSNSSLDGVNMQATQDAQVIGRGSEASGLAVVGNFGFWEGQGPFNGSEVDGLAWSEDGGRTFQFSDVGSESPTRYGSFPSRQVGYISAGRWPRSALQKSGFAVSQHLHVATSRYGAARLHLEREPEFEEDSNDGWMGEVYRSTDGFKTWQRVFLNTTWYANQIACPTEKICFVVGESRGDAYAVRTMDGGATWKTLIEARGLSLMAVQALSEKEIYIAGGELSAEGIVGTVFKSEDGGETFVRSKVPGSYFSDLSFVNSTLGYATAMNEVSTCNVLKFE